MGPELGVAKPRGVLVSEAANYHVPHPTDPNHPGFMTHTPSPLGGGGMLRYVKIKFDSRWHWALEMVSKKRGVRKFLGVNKRGDAYRGNRVKQFLGLDSDFTVKLARMDLKYGELVLET